MNEPILLECCGASLGYEHRALLRDLTFSVRAGKARMRLWSVVTVDCPYPMLERLKLLAAAHGGTVEGTDFGAAVSVHILLPQENTAGFDVALTELSAGSLAAQRKGERFLPGARE